MRKLIVFDCDGVMFDSKNANIKYYNYLLNHYSLPDMSCEEEDHVHIHSVEESIRHIFRHYVTPSFEEVNSFRLQGDYTPFLPYMTIEPDLVEFIETVKSTCHLAISTNRSNTMIPLLKTFHLDHYFGKVVTSATARRPKPAPDGLLEILEHYNCHPDEAIFIGDSIIDEQHAASCNVDLIAFKNNKLRAKFHVKCFMDILQLPL